MMMFACRECFCTASRNSAKCGEWGCIATPPRGWASSSKEGAGFAADHRGSTAIKAWIEKCRQKGCSRPSWQGGVTAWSSGVRSGPASAVEITSSMLKALRDMNVRRPAHAGHIMVCFPPRIEYDGDCCEGHWTLMKLLWGYRIESQRLWTSAGRRVRKRGIGLGGVFCISAHLGSDMDTIGSSRHILGI
jgi:hypothetical protein